MDDVTLTDTQIDADGNTVYYYSDGTNTVVSPTGGGFNMNYFGSAPGGTDYSIYSGSTPTATPNPQTDKVYVPVGQGDTPATIAARVASAQVANPNAQIVLPSGVSNAAINSILASLAGTAGRYIAQQVGGNTVLYRQNSGGIGSLNIQQLLIPAAIVAAIMLAS